MSNIKWRVLSPEEYKIKAAEKIVGREKNVPIVYLDPVGIPTIGPGKAMIVAASVNDKMKWVIAEGRPVEAVEMLEGTTGSKLTVEQREMLQKAADNLNRYGKGDDAYNANRDIYYNKPISVKDSDERVNPANSRFGINLGDKAEEFKDKVIDATEQDLNRRTEKALKNPTMAIPLSEERISLLSVVHHKPNAISEDMRKAINAGDRKAVVSMIENDEPKYRSRRKAEADQFGRPDDPAVIRHENNSQADLDATLKKAPQAIPEREVLPKQEVPVRPSLRQVFGEEDPAQGLTQEPRGSFFLNFWRK